MHNKTLAAALVLSGLTFVPAAIAAPHGAGAPGLGSGGSPSHVGGTASAIHAAPSVGAGMRGARVQANTAGPRVYGWRSGGGRNVHHHRGRGVGVIVGNGYLYDDDDYGYGGCEALHERAVETGSRYWWQRYRACAG
jgi:hypothetical protein